MNRNLLTKVQSFLNVIEQEATADKKIGTAKRAKDLNKQVTKELNKFQDIEHVVTHGESEANKGEERLVGGGMAPEITPPEGEGI